MLNLNRAGVSFAQQLAAIGLAIVAFVLLSNAAQGQDVRLLSVAGNGSIKGRVTDNSTGEGLIGASVRVAGTRLGAYTNLDGDFLIDPVPSGRYKLLVSYVGYYSDSVSIEVKGGQATLLDLKMQPEGLALGTVEIVGDRSTISSTDASVLNEMRTARVTASGVSSIQISLSLDRDASDVVKRVPGVTIQGDRYVVIRGLSERYNSVYLNDVPAPSADADKRSFSFDLIPSNLMDRLLIFKAPAADLPGDFAGGAVKVYTKNSSDAFQVQLSVGTSFRSGSSFQDGFNSTQGSSTDWLGYDNGLRRMPKIPANLALASLADNITYARAFRNEWVPTKQTSPLDYKVGLNYYDSWKVFGKRLRNLTSINYSRSYEHYRITRKDLDPAGSLSYQYNDLQSTDGVRIGILQNFSLALNEKNRIEWKTFFNQVGADQATQRYGFELSQSRYAYALYYRSRSLLSSQVSGVHTLTEQLQLDWFGGFNYTDRQEPDFRRILLQGGPSNSSNPAEYPTVTIQPGGAANPKVSSRFFSSLYERSYTGGFNLEQKWDGGWVVKVGGLFKEEDRNFAARIFNFVSGPGTQAGLEVTSPLLVFGPQNLRYDGTGFLLNEFVSIPRNDYDASNQLLAGYVAGNIPLFEERLNIYLGVRYEQNKQTLKFVETNVAMSQERIFPTLLPSANLTYKLTASSQLRGSYGRTVNRPELREIAPFSFYDFDLQSQTIGNRSLNQSIIDNLDVRYEWYPSLNEMVGFGAFYKIFTNPIELNSSPATPDRAYKPQNAKDAYAAGVEVEFRKKLDFLAGGRFFEGLSATFNASYIFSKVNQIDSIGSAQIQNRPLQGQSPYIINAGLFWSNEERGWQINLLYNVFGNRIFAVGDQVGGVANNPTVYERPRNVLDLSVTKKFGKHYEVKFGIADILNQPIRFFQDFNSNKSWDEGIDNQYFSYRPGQVYSFSVTYKIF